MRVLIACEFSGRVDTPAALGWQRAIAALDRVAELVNAGQTVVEACEQVKKELATRPA